MPHLIETYALRSGVKIRKPFILEKFFPMGVDKYITFHPFSKYDSKCYDFWQDVIDELSPVLKENGITIVQIGAPNEKQIKGCYSTTGQTNIGQSAFILSKSMLHLGADSFATHIASAYKKKIVAIYSNNFAKVVRPYWSSESDVVLLEPDRKGGKPSFAAQENPKTINQIAPEKIINAVCKMLGINYESKYKTVCVGQSYGNKFLESLPNQILNISQFGIDSLVVRMDFEFNEHFLIEQLKTSKCSIVTNKPINLEILKTFKENIKDVIFKADSNEYNVFISSLNSLNINSFIVTDLEGEPLKSLKMDFLDLGSINSRQNFKEEIEKTKKQLAGRKGYYKSAKTTLSNGQIFPSRAALLANKPVDNFIHEPQEIIDNEEFWKEVEYFKILV